MQRNPAELYELGPAAPNIADAPMLHYLEGFIDAGNAGRLLTDHLLQNSSPETVARFDTDRLLDYRSRRPLMIYNNSSWESYDAPELALHLLKDSGQQQEGPPAGVPEQVKSQFRGVVAFPAAVVVDHQRTPGPVVEEPVGVESRHRLRGGILQQMISEQAARVARVDEALEIVQHGRVRGLRRGGTEFVQFFRVPLHPYSLAWAAG
jgi:hypothetical protein